MNSPNSAPFRIFAESEGFDPEWLLARVRHCLPTAPKTINDEFVWSTEYNRLLLTLRSEALAAFHVANFKAFGPKPQRVPFAPITLLFGPNSAGKSSLLQALLYAQHSVAKDTLDVRFPSGAGTLVDLGNFADMVHGHDSDATVQFGFEFAHLLRRSDPDSKPMVWWVGVRNAKIASATLQLDGADFLHFAPSQENASELRCLRVSDAASHFGRFIDDYLPSIEELVQRGIDPNDARFFFTWLLEQSTVGALRVRIRGLLPEDAFVDPKADLQYGELTMAMAFVGTVTTPSIENQDWIKSRIKDAAPLVLKRLTNVVFMQVFSQAEYFLRTLDYLSSVRVSPGRDLQNIDHAEVNHSHNGGASWLQIATDAKTRESLNHWFTILQKGPQRGLAYYAFEAENDLNQIAVEEAIERVAHDYLMEKYQQHEEDRANESDADAQERFYFPFDQLDAAELATRVRSDLSNNPQAATGQRLIIRDLRHSAKPRVSPAEIGTGIQYLLPVLVETMAGGSTQQIIEEPELHAHPALQAELGDVFLRGALSTDDSSWRRRFIIETHSEHLILRILRRIRGKTEGADDYPDYLPKIRPEDVAVAYAEPSSGGTVLHHLRIDTDGRFLDDWPTGFFAERLDEVL